jgi:hypothetical protein
MPLAMGKPGSGYMHNALLTSKLKYSDFCIRLPDLDELHAIDMRYSLEKQILAVIHIFIH